MVGVFELKISMGEPGMTCAENLAAALEEVATKLRGSAQVLAGDIEATAAIFAGDYHVGHWSVDIQQDNEPNEDY